jgi:hypothetical protein
MVSCIWTCSCSVPLRPTLAAMMLTILRLLSLSRKPYHLPSPVTERLSSARTDLLEGTPAWPRTMVPAHRRDLER